MCIRICVYVTSTFNNTEYMYCIEHIEERLGVKTGLLRAFRFTLIASLSIHFQASLWYLIACNNLSEDSTCSPGTWANYENFRPGTYALFNVYLNLIYHQKTV